MLLDLVEDRDGDGDDVGRNVVELELLVVDRVRSNLHLRLCNLHLKISVFLHFLFDLFISYLCRIIRFTFSILNIKWVF